MKRALLDNHIFDALKPDPRLCAQIKDLARSQRIEIVVPRTIAEELYQSPHLDVLNRFPYRYAGNTVGRCGILRCGDSLGEGPVYYKHLGVSKKFNDALIVDAASCIADWLVSNDDRLCRRAKPLLPLCEIIPFAVFKRRILDMAMTLTEDTLT